MENKLKMKTAILILISLISNLTILKGQNLGQDANGETSILLKGGSLGLDAGEKEISFNMLDDFATTKKNDQWFLGFSAKGKNKSGVANIFNGGDLTPSSRGTLILGFKHWGSTGKEDYRYIKKLKEKQESLKKLEKETKEDVIDLLLKIGLDPSGSPRMHENVLDTLLDFKEQWEGLDPEEEAPIQNASLIFNGQINKIKNHIKTIPRSSRIQDFETLLDGLEKLYEKFKSKKSSLKNKYIPEIYTLSSESYTRDTNKKYYGNWTLFLCGGLDASKFKLLDKIDTVDVANSFQKTYFRGGFIGLGINWSYKKNILGIKVQYEESNNLEILEEKEYTLTTITNSNNQSLKSEEKITAYEGSYKTFSMMKIALDDYYFWDYTHNYYAVINPYWRSNFSLDEKIQPTTHDFGIGVYTYKEKGGKFVGGIYIEATDLDNAIEKAKETPNLRPINKRLTFGLVARYTFNSIVAFR